MSSYDFNSFIVCSFIKNFYKNKCIITYIEKVRKYMSSISSDKFSVK